MHKLYKVIGETLDILENSKHTNVNTYEKSGNNNILNI